MSYKRLPILLLLALMMVFLPGTTVEAAPTKIRAERIQTDVSSFDGNLSASDTDVQIALETLDEIGSGSSSSASTTVPANGEAVSITLQASFTGAASTAFVNVNCGLTNSSYQWSALSSRWPIENMVTFKWTAETGDLVVWITNSSETSVEAVAWFGS